MRKKGKCSDIYSFASASLLFISLLFSLSSGFAVLEVSALFFLAARPDAICLSLAFFRGLWLVVVFFGLEGFMLGFSTCMEGDRQNDNTQMEKEREREGETQGQVENRIQILNSTNVTYLLSSALPQRQGRAYAELQMVSSFQDALKSQCPRSQQSLLYPDQD